MINSDRDYARRTQLLAAATFLTLGVSCGGESPGQSVASLVDVIQASGLVCVHRTLPSPQRLAALRSGDAVGELGSEVRREPQDDGAGGQALRQLIERGESIVSALSELLRDEERRTVAAYVLAEMGGQRAASALWHEFRPLLGRVQRRAVVLVTQDDGGQETLTYEGIRHEKVDQGYYSELYRGLCYVGKPVVEGVIRTLAESLRDAHTMAAHNVALKSEERLVRDGQEYLESWPASPITKTVELLWMLGMIGDERATPQFVSALQSPLPSIRDSALEPTRWLASEATLPALLSLTDNREFYDPARGVRVSDKATEVIAFVLERRVIRPEKLTRGERQAVTEVYRRKVRDKIQDAGQD